MGEHLVIDEFVAFGRLDDAIQRQHATDLRILKDDQILKVGFLAVQYFSDSQRLPQIGMKRLFVPLQPTRPRLCSDNCTNSG